jgi:hypothetical protein
MDMIAILVPVIRNYSNLIIFIIYFILFVNFINYKSGNDLPKIPKLPPLWVKMFSLKLVEKYFLMF